MKKKIMGLTLAAAMLLTPTAFAAGEIVPVTDPDQAVPVSPEVPSANSVYVKEVLLDKLAVDVDGVTLLPLRALAETLGYTVGWEAATNSATVETKTTTITLTLGSKFITVGEKTVELALAPILIKDSTYVSEEFVTAALGSKVDFDSWRVSVDGLVDLRDADATLNLTVGESFKIGLEENATTGYLWSYKADPDTGLTLVKEDTNAPEIPAGMVGTPNFHIWEMKAEKAGSYTLTFVYDRSFSPSENPTTYTYTIVVK